MKTVQIAPDHKGKLHGWVYTFNMYLDVWQAAKREDKDLLFNEGGGINSKIVSAKDFDNLIILICTTDEAETM